MSVRIILSFDPGSSLTKVIYQIDRGDGVGKKQYLRLMEPSVLKIPLTRVEVHQKTSVLSMPLADRLWVQSRCQDEYEVAAVGFLAQQLQLGSGERYQELKYEVALYKLLAVIGLIVKTHQLPQPVYLSVSCVLPYSEYGNREQLRALLSQNMRSFQLLDASIEGILEHWQCFPESFGMLHLSQAKSDAPEQVVSLMFGHRNISCLVFHRGMLVEQCSQSTDLGFRQLVESVAQRASIQDRPLLMQVLYKLERLGKLIRVDEPLIQRLCQSRDPSNRATEARLISTAIEQCVEEYWCLVRSWLSSQMPLNIDQVVIAGGAAYYLQRHLREHFSTTPQYWAEEHLGKIPKILGFKVLGLASDDVNSEALAVRLMDIYGIHQLAMSRRLSNRLIC
ncbi:MAG: ParM/StbA family protein [Cyanobacteria bacterium P01_F01_bin.150]